MRTGNTATEDIPTLVVDASVVVKWLLPEDGQSHAFFLQDLYADEKLNLIAPPILIAEGLLLISLLWKPRRWASVEQVKIGQR